MVLGGAVSTVLVALGFVWAVVPRWSWWVGLGHSHDCDHQWDPTITTVVARKPLLVEYECRVCRAWTVEQRDQW
jgi:hypothetical protein